jgi:diguanylate cyclase (GGDEF)-like protein
LESGSGRHVAAGGADFDAPPLKSGRGVADIPRMTGLPIDLDLLQLGLALSSAVSLGAGTLWWRQKQRYARLEATLARKVRDGGPVQRVAVGLVSRAAFGVALDGAVAQCDRERSALCVLMVELDDFADVNSVLGHAAGDDILYEFAARVHAATPAKVAATKMGIDQIALIVACGGDAGIELAQRLTRALAQPYRIPGHEPQDLSASIGVAAYPAHGARAMIVAHAAAAARAAQEAGGGTHAVFDPKTVEDMRARAQLLSDLRGAIGQGQLELFYQPKIDTRSLQVTAAEALIRWRHPTLGMVSPAVFIPIAERHGLISAIGNWVIDEACRQAGVWRQSGLRMRVAINLSAFQMRQDDFIDRLESALRRNQLQPGRFTVEITESLAMENTQATQRTFERLRQGGLHVAIDDFGAGQTSLAYLRALPASELKLDISLVKDLEHSHDARTIAEALVRLAHALQRRVVAEGVETPAQRDLLVMMGCDELQGFLFARPMSARAFGIWALDKRAPGDKMQFRPSLFKETTAERAA